MASLVRSHVNTTHTTYRKTGNVRYLRNIEARTCNHCCCGLAINATYSECMFVALFIQHAMCMCHIILSFVACSALRYFPHYLIKGTILFLKKDYLTQNVCFDLFNSFVLNISLSNKNWARYYQKCILVFISSTRYACQILIKLEFSRHIFEKY